MLLLAGKKAPAQTEELALTLLCGQTPRAAQTLRESSASPSAVLGHGLPVSEHLSHWLYLAAHAGLHMDTLELLLCSLHPKPGGDMAGSSSKPPKSRLRPAAACCECLWLHQAKFEPGVGVTHERCPR